MVRSILVALLVDCGVEGARARFMQVALRDDRDGAARLDMVEDGVGVISLVGDDMAGGSDRR